MQKVLQSATAENDNPDIRDRAYVYWRLLSSDPQIAKNIVLAQRPQIESTIPVLPTHLLESLLPELSTLASVYHKPPKAFLARGRGKALQAEAIEEAKQNARENPIAAAAVSAAISGVPHRKRRTTQKTSSTLTSTVPLPHQCKRLQSAARQGSKGLQEPSANG